MVARSPSERYVLFLAVLCVLVFLSIGLASAQEDDAELRVVHAGYDLGAVDVYLDGELAIEALDYGAITEYVVLESGDHLVQVTAAGSPASEAIIDTRVTLDPDAPHTVIGIGPADAPDIIVIIDDHSAPADGMVRLSLVNATTDGVAVSLAAADGNAVVDTVPSADASEFVELTSGAYDFAVTSEDTGEEIATITGVSLDAGGIYSVFVMGVAGDYLAVAVEDVPGQGTGAAEPTPTMAAGATTPTTGDVDGTATSATTPGASVTPTASAGATATAIPGLPATGSGGASDGPGAGVLVAGAAAVAVVLLGAVVWRRGLLTPGGRR